MKCGVILISPHHFIEKFDKLVNPYALDQKLAVEFFIKNKYSRTQLLWSCDDIGIVGQKDFINKSALQEFLELDTLRYIAPSRKYGVGMGELVNVYDYTP